MAFDRTAEAARRRGGTLAGLVLLLCAWSLHGQTAVDLSHQGKLGSGSALPATCTVGQLYFVTTAASGANVYACNASNTWTAIGQAQLSGDASGTLPAVTVSAIQGHAVSSNAPSDQNVLVWNAASGKWIPQAMVTWGATAPPATCQTGNLYLENDTIDNIHQLFVCAQTNTWTTAATQSGLAANRPVNCILGQTWLATDTGTMTYCAATGNPGTWSATLAGPQGPTGLTGAAGNTVLNGTGAPSSGAGNNGDFFLNTATMCIYGPKALGAWPGTCTTLVGPTGAAGSTGATGAAGANGNTLWNGTAAPGSGTGANGDFYLNTAASCLYGPKASGAWPGTCTTLTGATGPAGPIAGTSGQLTYNNAGSAAGSNLSQNSDGSISAAKGFNEQVCSVTFSATPTFDVANCNRFELGTMTANVTASTILHLKAGLHLKFVLPQDSTGGRSMVWPSGFVNVCQPWPSPSTVTVQDADVMADGVTVRGTGCTTDSIAASLSTGYLTENYQVGTTAIVANTFVKLTGGVLSPITGTEPIFGVAPFACAASSTSCEIAVAGQVKVMADTAIAVDHYLIHGSTNPAYAADGGQTDPGSICTSVRIGGRALASATAGTLATVQLLSPGMTGSQLCAVSSTGAGGSTTVTGTFELHLPVAACTGSSTSALAWNAPPSGATAATATGCSGTNVNDAAAAFANTGTPSLQASVILPQTLTASSTASVYLTYSTATAAGTFTPALDAVCSAVSSTGTDDPAWTANNFFAPGSQTAASTINYVGTVSATALSWPSSCTAGTRAHFRLIRTDTAGTATSVSIYEVVIVGRRTM